MVNQVDNNIPGNSSATSTNNDADTSLKNYLYIKEPTSPSSQAPGIESVKDPLIAKVMQERGTAYEYVNNHGNNGILGPVSFDAQGRVQNPKATHSLTHIPTGLYVLEDAQQPLPSPTPSSANPKENLPSTSQDISAKNNPSSPPVAANAKGSVKGDPHFAGFNRKHFDFHGKPGTIYNIISDEDFQLNAKVGSYGNKGKTVVAQVGIRIGSNTLMVSKGKRIFNGQPLKSGQGLNFSGGAVSVQKNKTNIVSNEYIITIIDNGKYLDIKVQTTGAGVNSDGVMPSGVLGQTALGQKNRKAKDFEVHDGILGTNFKSNKFGSQTAS